MFKSSTFDKLLDKATSHILMELDWTAILQICDLIRQDDIHPKNALLSIKKKLASPNPHTAMYALQVLESVVKNCPTVHDELTSKAHCDTLHDFVKSTQHSNVKQKMLELLQVWNLGIARKNPKHSNLKDLVGIMKAEGFTFPAMRESDAMFSADTAPKWVDGYACHRCRVQFGNVRKHHCRACGQVFCGQCSSKNTTLPKFGIEKEVRVCDHCFDQHTKPPTAKSAIERESDLPAEYLKSSLAQQSQVRVCDHCFGQRTKPQTAKSAIERESDLPPEYLKSSLAQESQVPPKKNKFELREEDYRELHSITEELRLALALHQSEAEANEKENTKVTTSYTSTTTFKAPEPARPVERSLTPEENPEISHYLNHSYWENCHSSLAQQSQANNKDTSTAGSSALATTSSTGSTSQENKRSRDIVQAISDLNEEVYCTEETPFDVFGKSIAMQLKKLSMENALLAQCKIQSILTEFGIKDHRERTASCSSNSSHSSQRPC